MMQDPFDALGLPPDFDLDRSKLEEAYFARSAVLHPDVAVGSEDAQREMAALNHARQVLADPEQRADILLKKLGGPAREEDKSLPPDFLMEMMEIRESVEAAVSTPDPATRKKERSRWEAWAHGERLKAIETIGNMFRRLNTPPEQAGLNAIRMELNAWRYIERLIEQLDPDYDPQRADF